MEFLTDIYKTMLPEVALIAFIFIQLILSMFCNKKYYKLGTTLSLIALIISTAMCSFVQVEPLYSAFKNSIISDGYTVFFKMIIMLSAFLIILLTKRIIQSRVDKAFQFNALLLTAVLGAISMVSANDFLTLLISMETLGFATFFLLAFEKGFKSNNATFKYIMISAVASAVFLFGISYLYGIVGSINFTEIYHYYLKNDPTVLYSLASIFAVFGLFFKLGVFPFANWIVDVYEDCESSVVAFLSVIPKLAMFAALTRMIVFPLNFSFGLKIIIIIAALITAFWANILALRQKNIKRLLACSSSANASYVLFAAVFVSPFSVGAVIFYLLAYLFMNIGVFSAVVILEHSNYSNKLREFKGFAHFSPLFALCFAICILGLAGFPVMSGFISKVYLFLAIARSGTEFLPMLGLMMIAVLVSVFYYVRIVKLMLEKSDDKEKRELLPKSSSAMITLYACAFITLLIGVMPSKIIEFCQMIAYNI